MMVTDDNYDKSNEVRVYDDNDVEEGEEDVKMVMDDGDDVGQ
jgi:hypothetical protein